MYAAVHISSEKSIGIVDSVVLPTLLKAFVKLHYEDSYVSQLENYPCSETQSFYLKKGKQLHGELGFSLN